MKTTSTFLLALAGLGHLGAAQTVVGEAEGFASGVTGGGSATAQTPADITELTKWLTDSTPRVIVLDKEYDFTESEGTESGNVCASWGTGSAYQRIIQDNCDGKPASTDTWYKAPRTPIDVASNKTIIGVGSKGIITGKGFRFTDGASNIIVQNIKMQKLNPKYVWGGDILGFTGSDLIWIDHVTTSQPGRQHYVFGHDPSTRITLSNNHIDGESPYSTGGDGYHYWTFEMVGKGDQITMKNNYITKTAGRSPALSGNTLLHAVNNVWEGNNGHALEGGETTARGIFEGNVFSDVKAVESDYKGKLFGVPDASSASKCESALGRSCEVNTYESSGGTLTQSDTPFFSDFSGLKIASAVAASKAQTDVPKNAGFGKLSDSSSTSPTTSSPSSSSPAKAASTSKSTATSKPTSTSTTSAKPTSEAATGDDSESDLGTVGIYGQCGGSGYSGSTTCAEGSCVKYNDWYSQCV
ncbi:unnamed protein product [Clonostachys rhizophaga]|uniref:pectin lyase n=1 Tax=Clonostachys rhizophaga TaxID=160324 RepID=A0A9N9V3C8_9HYPO|nr:unnamed protein product [Clonostachys rhizophaga]